MGVTHDQLSEEGRGVRGVLVAVAAALVVGPAPAVVGPAALVVGPATAAAAEPTPSPSSDNTRQVCTASARTVEDGLTAFVVAIQRVTDTANKGDLVAAEKSVQDAGRTLVTLGANLRVDAGRATARDVVTALRDLADEFERQGRSLTTLPAMQRFDSKRLETLAERMSVLCGGPPR